MNLNFPVALSPVERLLSTSAILCISANYQHVLFYSRSPNRHH
jgi:hypothetical protein